MRPVKPLLAALLAAALALVAVSAATAQEDKVVLTVGLNQDVDSFNVTVGELVASYEAWNLQYLSLTDKSAADFSPIPSLAEKWVSSNNGRTWTYTLRDGLEWSDGQPLTAEDVAYTINRARKEEWLNHASTVAHLTAVAKDPRTVVITTSVPNPQLPAMEVGYIVPKHVFEKYDADALPKYTATDGVGSGPFVLDKREKGQFWRMKANPNYYGGKSVIDEVVFRVFNNLDAMVAALEKGEIDAAHNVPEQRFKDLEGKEGIVTIQGQQGGFDYLALNGGDGLKKPHPALLDPKVRQAIAHAINKKILVDRVLVGLGAPEEAISPSANPEWIPEIPAAQVYDFDLAKAKKILDDAGYKDTNGDGIREMPGSGEELVFRYGLRTESDTTKPVAEFITGWLKEIGISTKIEPYSDDQLIEVIGKGEYELEHWGWTPFVDPDPMLSYFTCDQVSSDPKNPTDYYNDASWCDKPYDAMYRQQNRELDPEKRLEIAHRMLTRFYRTALYNVLYLSPDLQAYRTDRFTGWTRQPADIGPVLFTNTSPTYVNLRPVTGAAGGGGDGLGAGAIIGIAVGGAALIALAAWFLIRRRTAGERE